jgi:23S rRNA (adenine2030-N6)-methyltransferase
VTKVFLVLFVHKKNILPCLKESPLLNYRHAFHAGNFADCFKHALYVWLLRAMQRKETGFFALDTHAGIGFYDLSASEAERTGEWRGGIGKVMEADPPELADYLAVVRELGLYPGSPAIARALLRPQDRLAVCELHPDDAATLDRRFGRDGRVQVHRRDGYEAIKGLLPAPEKRVLVLIDPPFEREGEFGTLAGAIKNVISRVRGATVAVWYPVKHRGPVREFFEAVRASGVRDVVAAEIHLREPLDPARLNGCGMLVVSPPYRYAEEWPPMMQALLGAMRMGEEGEGISLVRVVEE